MTSGSMPRMLPSSSPTNPSGARCCVGRVYLKAYAHRATTSARAEVCLSPRPLTRQRHVLLTALGYLRLTAHRDHGTPASRDEPALTSIGEALSRVHAATPSTRIGDFGAESHLDARRRHVRPRDGLGARARCGRSSDRQGRRAAMPRHEPTVVSHRLARSVREGFPIFASSVVRQPTGCARRVGEVVRPGLSLALGKP